MPEVVARCKRPGSSLQNMILQQQQQPETSMGKSDKKTSQTASKGKQTNTNTTVTVDADHEIEQNPGILKYYIFRDRNQGN